MASSEGSAHAQWRRFFDGAGGANIFEIIDAAVAVASLDHPAELKRRRERIAQRLYTGGILSCGDDSVAKPLKGCRSVVLSKKEDRPPASFAEKATAPVKNELARKNFTKPPAAAADRNKAPAQPSEQSMEAMLATAKRRLKDSYKECEDAKRQRKIQVVEAPEMARQRQKNQNQNIRRRDQVRCKATIAEGRALMSTIRASLV